MWKRTAIIRVTYLQNAVINIFKEIGLNFRYVLTKVVIFKDINYTLNLPFKGHVKNHSKVTYAPCAFPFFIF